MQNSFPQEYKDLFESTGSRQVALLGRSEENWSPQAALLIDLLIRPYLLALAANRIRLIAGLD
jgi:hypothetical protein